MSSYRRLMATLRWHVVYLDSDRGISIIHLSFVFGVQQLQTRWSVRAEAELVWSVSLNLCDFFSKRRFNL